MTARPVMLTIGVLLAGVLAACGSSEDETAAGTDSPSPSSSAPSDASTAPAEEIVITITDFEYDVPESVPAGAEITVVNEDDVAHTVTATGDASFEVNVPGGESGTFTATAEAGEYEFSCVFHGNMTGTLVVV